MTTPGQLSSHELADQFRHGFPKGLPDDWANAKNVIGAHQLLAREAIQRTPPYPDHFRGRGIVICAGGHRLFTSAWVCIRMLRRVGCELPVQLWHLGESELDDTMRDLVASFGVDCVDAAQLAQRHPARILNGWEVKPYALLHCPFREVMLLDADNVVVKDPSYLFDTHEFREHGAIFWPDYSRLEPFRQIWHACEVEYRDEPEFESGQVVVDKLRCWQALNLTMHYNEHSDFYYCHIHGDKETFHLAFRRLGKSIAMPARGIHSLDATMCQHDFQGQRLFQHRNMDKWYLDGSNRRIDDFLGEDVCREFLAELRKQWSGKVHWNECPTLAERELIEECSRKRYNYVRVDHDSRPMQLRPNRTIDEGSADNERTWTITKVNGDLSLVIFGHEDPTCRLTLQNGIWQGRWYRHERMPIRLDPLDK